MARERISMSERRTLESSRWSIRWLRRTTSWLPVPSPLGFVLGSSAESCSAVLVFCVAWTPYYWGRLLRFREISGSWSFLATGYSHYGAVCWDLQQWIVIVLVILTLDPIIAYIYIYVKAIGPSVSLKRTSSWHTFFSNQNAEFYTHLKRSIQNKNYIDIIILYNLTTFTFIRRWIMLLMQNGLF